MGKFIKKRINQSTGFTIVELLIVIVIIGTLAAITLVSYIGISKRAIEAGLTSDLDGAKRQLELYKIEYESYPTILDTNKCPTSPNNDTKYCLKNKDFVYTTTDNGLTYTLKLTKSDITFEVTNDATPKVAEAAPALPESDWITIGTQRWARKNLDVGTRIDGTVAQTNNSTPEKYCYDNIEANCDSYGGLYIWNEAMNWTTNERSQGLCPNGSHFPSDSEWSVLEIQLGMNPAGANSTGFRGAIENIGTQLKTGGTSGLNIPLAGKWHTDGLFYSFPWTTHIWTSSESNGDVWARYFAGDTAVSRETDLKVFGYYVRCLGD